MGEPEQLNNVVRGPVAQLWTWFEEMRAGKADAFPQEVCFWGRAGTSKSMTVLQFILWICHRYPLVPGRILICRDTQRSLARSACVTIRKILPPGHPALDGPTDEGRTQYTIGKWTITLSGLSEPSRLYSTEWDIVFAEEAREISLAPWEEFSRGARNYALYRYTEDGVLNRDEKGNLLDPSRPTVLPVPWSALIAATNPDAKTHWLYTRGMSGAMAFLETSIKDNPGYWNIETDEPTPMGVAFDRRMSKATGVRRRRLYEGVWCSAEGAIYPDWDTDVHVLKGVKRDENGWIPRLELERLGITEFYGGVDFGWDNAGVMLIGGYTKERKLYVVAEVYHSLADLAWWTDWLVKIHKQYRLTLVFCDHNRPDWVLAWNDALGVPQDGPGAVCVRADKGIDRGHEIVRRRLSRRDGGPTLQFLHDCLLHEPDPTLLERRVPWRTEDCMPEYVSKRASTADDADETAARPEKPDKTKANTDGPDALRYLCVGVEYFEPEESLARTLSPSYRAKLMFDRRVRGESAGEFQDKLAEEAEMSELDEDDWIVDTIRDSIYPDGKGTAKR